MGVDLEKFLITSSAHYSLGFLSHFPHFVVER